MENHRIVELASKKRPREPSLMLPTPEATTIFRPKKIGTGSWSVPAGNPSRMSCSKTEPIVPVAVGRSVPVTVPRLAILAIVVPTASAQGAVHASTSATLVRYNTEFRKRQEETFAEVQNAIRDVVRC